MPDDAASYANHSVRLITKFQYEAPGKGRDLFEGLEKRLKKIEIDTPIFILRF